MGTFHQRIELASHPDAERWEPVDALVDTASVISWIPRDILERAGIEPIGERIFRLADDSIVYRDIGAAYMRLGDDLVLTRVVFAAPGTEPILGVAVLETLLLAPDPVNKKLIPIESRAYGGS